MKYPCPSAIIELKKGELPPCDISYFSEQIEGGRVKPNSCFLGDYGMKIRKLMRNRLIKKKPFLYNEVIERGPW